MIAGSVNVLSIDKNVFKENNLVKRPVEKWSNNIHSLLKHFYNNGLPVPKIIKTDTQYEYLEHINGELIHPYKWNNELLHEYELPAPKERAEQARLIMDTYGLSKGERKCFFEKIIETIICETAHEAIDERVTFDTTGKLWGMAWRSRSLYWIWRNKSIIKKAIE